MKKAGAIVTDEIFLCREETTKDELLNQITVLQKRSLIAEICNVRQSEFFKARQSDLQADIMVKIFYLDYDDEKIVQIGEKLYDVYRTYFNEKTDEMELYLSERVIISE